ncbi:Ankyrin repeat-containing protein [Komagataella phaffii CBS 7435]|uniref:Uncharacterized protein n=2 Tax=Komagataella phaffii TaxID=460519 RepID=C4QXJ2_KOMPG|nr:Cytoplasmic ankyrin-repeat containing protein of unknown function [Komagataella phaffii GS115]AOA60518.1 GQ67_02050T0 [Komagataella phaffii]CAH2446779.1 Ankyrin repeat-containing protein [Komagataella phaffii CBS 7435]AOA66174.1 GQ68_02065T0 [Komagataella phaffii GS115]CAY67965.1 Cytoplasmic ankyrin-repeat containing protein of unknown function [Komagataella phaffii GS115]CCA37039.1 Ankyrin repeat-containing protein [Komagataella phaffii CBS 7435]
MITQLTQEEVDILIDEARYGELDSLKEIFQQIDPKVLLSIHNDITLTTPFHMAAANGHTKVLDYLLSLIPKEEVKTVINKQNESGSTALHWSALNGHLEVVKLLCEKYDADPFIKNSAGHDAIYEAEMNNKEDVETYFLEKYSVEPENNHDDDTVEFNEGTEIQNATKDAVDSLSKDAEKVSIN